MPEPTAPKDILTPEEFAALVKDKGLKFPDRRNTALHKGGSVDIYTATDDSVFAVVRFVKITDEIRKEVVPLIAEAKAKAKSQPAAE